MINEKRPVTMIKMAHPSGYATYHNSVRQPQFEKLGIYIKLRNEKNRGSSCSYYKQE